MSEREKQEAERAAFEGWYAPIFKGGEPANMTQLTNGEYRRPQDQIAWMAWQAARRSPAVGEDGLPPLPAPAHRGPDGTGSYFDSYTAEQVRQAQREAVEADRRARPELLNLDEDDEVSFPGDGKVAVIHEARYWQLRAIEEHAQLALQSAPNVGMGEPIGTVVAMPGSGGGFTMCAFEASRVPVGAVLYFGPSAPQQASQQGENDVG